MKKNIQMFIKDLLKMLSEKERKVLLNWAENCKKIINSKWGKTRKFAELIKLSGEYKTLKSTFKIMWRLFKKYIWVDRGFVTKFAMAGAALGIAIGQFGGAGIAALGSAIGIPFFLVTAAGGSFLGMLINEIKNTLPKQRKKDKSHKTNVKDG